MNGENRSSHTRQEIGRTLERARRERGLSLQQVEQATKIRVKYLRDLENENLDVLPAVYMLGSLKTYAAHLGLDGEVLAREFKRRQALLQEEQNQAQVEPPASEPRGLIASLSRLLGAESPETAEDDSATVPDPGHSPRLYLSFGVVLIFVLAIALVSTLGAKDQPSVSQVHEPKISSFPAMIALAGNLGDERNIEAENKEVQPENEAKAPPKDEGKDERVKAERDGHHEDGPRMAQASSSSATATASPASPASTASATATPRSARPEPAATEDADGAGKDIAAVAPSGASAPAPAGPVVQRKQAGPVNAARLRDRITSRAWNVVEGARRPGLPARGG